MTPDLRAAIEREIASLEDAAQFVLRSHEKIVPMGLGEVTRLSKLLRTLLDAVKELERDADDERKWATHYARHASLLHDTLTTIVEAYSHPHSPQHRASVLADAKTVLQRQP